MNVKDTWTGTLTLGLSKNQAAVRHWRAEMRRNLAMRDIHVMHHVSRTAKPKLLSMTTAQSKSLVKRR